MNLGARQATCEEAEKWEAVMDLFEEMKQLGVEPSRQSYEYVTRACKEYLVGAPQNLPPAEGLDVSPD